MGNQTKRIQEAAVSGPASDRPGRRYGFANGTGSLKVGIILQGIRVPARSFCRVDDGPTLSVPYAKRLQMLGIQH